MKTSELIQELTSRLRDHGDQEVLLSTREDNRCVPLIQVSNEAGSTVFIRDWKYNEDK